MTSPAEVETPAEEHPDDAGAEEGSSPSPVTPWSSKPQGRRQGDAPGAPGQPGAPGANGSGQNGAGSGTTSPGANPGAGNGNSGSGQPGAPGAGSAPSGTAAPQAAAPPAPQGQVAPGQQASTEPEPDQGLGSDVLASAIPAGAMALSMLPMIASALAGLGGSGGDSGSGGSSGDSGSSGGLSPEAEEALKTLKLLAAVYGEGDTTDPEVKQLRKELGVNGSGSGSTATSIKARQLWQANAATAFNNLDNQLATYIIGLAGNHKIDKKAVAALVREVNVALAELGPQAYTKAGQQKVHQILTTALQKAHSIVSGTTTSAKDTANAINRLTGQYLYNLNGQQYPGSTSTSTVGGTVGQWIQQALQVLQAMGYDISKIDPKAIAIIIQNESGGNPNATNNWDSNAASGTPSKGLMQTIGPTFNQWAASGHKNIYNPVDNIVAGVRYAINRYGSVSNVPGVKAVRNGRDYVGY
ncbi:DUF4226 domain-containing protein [Nocardia sp. NBC_00565]|uniref:DUF4226 domain-containing protein n=1 Tax=Nocardia sp. NBC_00565 TaxID=2975993 RepID=UPI002E81F0A4|nr:DUF4226 domain-containing protein [Nocardia sp. NBC_00565]WUC07687.1 DUF4226 domain-containing protein [Nocardia sp. NBC_00565]